MPLPGQSLELDLNKILIVDDERSNLFLLDHLLQQCQFTTIVAHNGVQALEKAHAEAPFLVLSDIQMPQMDGLELCRQLKADARTRDMAVIFITAHARNAEFVSEGLALGADDFVFRPVQLGELKARIEAVARLKRAELLAQKQTRIVTKRNEALALLNELSAAINSSLDLEEVLALSLRKLGPLFQAETISILLPHPDRPVITAYTTLHSVVTVSTEVPFEVDLPALDETLPEQRCQILTTALERYATGLSPALLHQKQVCLPMVTQGQTVGVVAITGAEADQFGDEDWSLFQAAVNIISIAVQNARLFRHVQALNQQLEQKVRERTAQLQAEKEKLEAILANLSEGVLVTDTAQRIVAVNVVGQQLLSLGTQDLVGLSLITETPAGPLWEIIRTLIQGETPETTTISLTNAAGSDELRAIHLSSAKVKLANNEPLGTVLVFSDVTALTQVERMKARFMSGVTHELKTPLTVIRVHAKNMLKYADRLPAQKQSDLLRAIEHQALLLQDLVEKILTISRLDSGETGSQREKVELLPLAAQVLEELRPLADEKQIKLGQLAVAPLAPIHADPEQMSQVIRNLLSNALKYTPADGVVALELGQETCAGRLMARLRVSDTGMGIAPEEQSRIFDRFYRIDTAHTIPGSGLGLSIVSEIVKAYGGEIRLQSELQRGSTFEVLLPCLEG